MTHKHRRNLYSDMNRKQRRAAAKGNNEFLIGVQISKQVREFFGEERAGQLGSDLLSTVLKTMKPDAMPDRSVLFQLTPKIDGSELCFAVELDWPAVNGRNQERNRPVPSRHRRAVVEEFAGNGPLDRFSEGDQMQFRPATTAHAKSSQRDGRTHQFQKAPARPFVAV